MSSHQLQLIPASAPVAFVYKGHEVLFDDNRLISLTGMWKAVGSPANRDPRFWRRLPDTLGFIDNLVQRLDVRKSNIVKSSKGGRGGGGETWAHWQIALAYAKYLSHDFHLHVNQAYKEWSQEKADPALKVERAAEEYRRRGHDDAWVGTRLAGINQRNALTATLADHGCRVKGLQDNPFAEASRLTSLAATGMTPREIKDAKGLPKSARTRDLLDRHQLAAVWFIESESERLIKQHGAEGNDECLALCRQASQGVKNLLSSLAAPRP